MLRKLFAALAMLNVGLVTLHVVERGELWIAQAVSFTLLGLIFAYQATTGYPVPGSDADSGAQRESVATRSR